jgi:hypothetical protein
VYYNLCCAWVREDFLLVADLNANGYSPGDEFAPAKYSTFQAVNIAVVVLVSAAILLLFPFLYVQLVPGLVVLWGEIAVGIMRGMLATGNFTKLYLVCVTMLAMGLVITALSFRLGTMLLGTLVLMVAFPMILIVDMLNDYIVVTRLERAAESAKASS